MKYLPQPILAFLSVAFLTAIVFGQTTEKDNLGKEFYIAFGANQGAASDFAKNDTARFVLYITSPVVATGYVEVAALQFSVSFTTTPGQITAIYLPDGDGSTTQTVEVTTSEVIATGMGVHI